MIALIAGDLRRKALWCYGRDRRVDRLKALLTDGSLAMVLYRLMQWSHRRRLAPLAMVFNKMIGVCCHCVIGRGADFGPGLVLVHSMGIVINGEVRGGSGVTIMQQVTLGADERRCPTVGDGVFIGAGAKIIGPVSIGDGARIGANAVVIYDVPAYATVGGIPARVVRRREPGFDDAEIDSFFATSN